MITILWIVAILQWISFIYLPVSIAYAAMRLAIEKDPMPTICSPFLGLKNINPQLGFGIWIIQLILAGVVLYDLTNWWRLGINPIIRMW